jgi:threonine/homoserine/homoserine lactone efflux protein
MGAVIGDLLPLAVGVAVSPMPIVAVILMLLAPRAGGASAGFLAGWLLGIVVACTAFLLLAGSLSLGTSSEPSTTGAWVKIILGLLLLAVGLREWRARPRPGADPSVPKWMAAIDSFTAMKAAGLGFLLAAVNPKNLLLCASAGATIAAGSLSTGQDVGAVAVFTVIAASTVAVPVCGYAVARSRMAQPLAVLKEWLTANNAAVMSVLLLVIGASLVGKGIGGL